MVAKNDITGDSIRSKSLSDTGRDNWDRIFGKKEVEVWEHRCKHNGYMSIGKGEECSWCGAKENEETV